MDIINRPRVAVIGAGVSGVVTAAHLIRAGLDVSVFERSSHTGGIWHFDERLPPEPAYPSTRPSVVEYWKRSDKALEGGDGESPVLLEHAPPGPCYESLTNNVSTPLLRTKLNAWPDGTADFVTHKALCAYIQDTATKGGVDAVTIYNTSVEDVRKNSTSWSLRSSTLHKGEGSPVEREWEFDAVVVASGHYHSCHVPEISGLANWKVQFPDRIMHSKSYRRSEGFEKQNVLLIGAGVSSLDIAHDLSPFVKRIFQVSRGGKFDLIPKLLPPNAVRIGEIAYFEQLNPSQHNSGHLSPLDPIPATVVLKNGQRICDIHRIILCTGYHISYPFLRHLHSDGTPAAAADETVLVTDGGQNHNLHKDIFYIPDPSLAFVGVPYYTATFTLFEFQAIAIAAVFAGKVPLPSSSEMREEYNQKLKVKGPGRQFHSLKGDGEEIKYAKDLVNWVNAYGLDVEGHTQEWHEANSKRLQRVRVLTQSTAEDQATLDRKQQELLPLLKVCG
ncbi:MAG: hypothetical protein M1820_001217 [Bogoriella megaspora]|nr:MAG: hypothetical protein M1820_001217 [Bogoriella megaspora]